MKEIKVSIILPSLNVVDYIKQCLESVVNQTLKEIEIICVDAGSVDGTLEVIKEYMLKDNRVKLILSEKKSYGYQMNIGMKSAKGHYIGIVETDDYVPNNMYEELYKIAFCNDVDFVKTDFYRFTEEKECQKNVICNLTSNAHFYNRIIDISKEKKCFSFPINTWSGIYKNDFIKKNNIKHNETPGASFQDNGFWFQTFIYAKRAYFINKPYYMNRRDNPGSSVFNKNKVNCICEEYEYIENIIRNSKNIFDNYKFVFSYACYLAYKGTLERIAHKYKESFLNRFAEDFRRFREQGMLDSCLFGAIEWDNLLAIMESPSEYYKKNILEKKCLLEQLRTYEKVIIYGAGVIGKRLLHEFVYNDNPIRVFSFAVTKIENNAKAIQNVPIKCIYELIEYKDSAAIIVATTTVYQEEIKQLLKTLGFVNVFFLPEGMERGPLYYEKIQKNEYPKELEKWYSYITGKKIDLNNPLTFNEKQQWLKINEQSELKKTLTDKYEMRKWVQEKIGEEFLVPILGVYNNVEELEFEKYPEQFIIKCTHGKGWNIFVEDKNNPQVFNKEIAKRRLKTWMTSNCACSSGFNLNYKDIKPRIIIEHAVDGIVKKDKFKILCFNGKPCYIVCDNNKLYSDNIRRDIYDVEWRKLPVSIKYPNSDVQKEKPKMLKEMLHIAKILSENFKFVVVHLFETDKGILFNEIKFTFGNGVQIIEPSSFDYELGKMIDIAQL